MKMIQQDGIVNQAFLNCTYLNSCIDCQTKFKQIHGNSSYKREEKATLPFMQKYRILLLRKSETVFMEEKKTNLLWLPLH